MKNSLRKLCSIITLVAISSTFGLTTKTSAQTEYNVKNLVPEIQNTVEATSATDSGLAKTTNDGVILHAWNWYFGDVAKYMSKIAECGYTSVQVSPIQHNKDGTFGDTKGWWKLYQPTDFAIGNTLGSKDDFKNMCDEADKYGIKIIVDVVANHLANQTGGKNNDPSDRSSQIPAYIKDNNDYWHGTNYGAFSDDNDRQSMTQGAIGMPDLNSSNKGLQEIIVKYLNEAQDLGADGFRFDAAKHIELPTDTISSDFWPTITDAIKGKDSKAFIYGEVLNTCAIDIKNYTKYIGVTDNRYGFNVINAVQNTNAGAANNYTLTDSPKNFITWVESHDTYAGDYGNKSDKVSDENINIGWCMIAARADAVPLYFVRPAGGMGGKIGGPGDTAWQDASVVAVNKFHNYFAGKTEYVRDLNNNSVFEVERGDAGAVLVNLGGGSADINTETKLASGTYKDQVSGSTFTVSGGKLTGKVEGKKVAVIYNPTTTPNPTPDPIKPDPIKPDPIKPDPVPVEPTGKNVVYMKQSVGWADAYAYIYDEGTKGVQNGVWPGVQMTKLSDGLYSCEVPTGYTKPTVIFSDGKTGGSRSTPDKAPGLSLDGTMIYDGTNLTKYEPPIKPIPDPVKPDPVKPDPVKPDPVKPDPVKPDPVKPDPVKPDPVKPIPDPVKPDPIKPTPDPIKPTPQPEIPVVTASLSFDVTSKQEVGKEINMTASVSSENSEYEYRFKAISGNITKVIKDFSSDDVATWEPSSKGDYSVFVEVRDKNKNIITSDKYKFTITAASNVKPATGTVDAPDIPPIGTGSVDTKEDHNSEQKPTADGNAVLPIIAMMTLAAGSLLKVTRKQRNNLR